MPKPTVDKVYCPQGAKQSKRERKFERKWN